MFARCVVYVCILSTINCTNNNWNDLMQSCVEEIQYNFLNPTDFIINLILSDNVLASSLHFNTFPMVYQNHSTYLVSRSLVKTHAYVLFVSEKRILSTLSFLLTTSEWNSRAKFILILEEDGGTPSKIFQALKEHYVFNVVLLIPSQLLIKIEIYSFFPYDYSLPEEKRANPVLLDACVDGKFERGTNLYPEKLPKDWSNTTVRTIFFEYYPYVFCSACGENITDGIEVSLFQLVQSILRFNVSYIVKPYHSWGTKTENNSYNEAYGDLQTNTADLGVGVFYLNASTFWDFDFTIPYMEDASKWAVPAANRQPHWKSIAKIFNWYMWSILLICFFVAVLVMYSVAMRLDEISIYQKLSNCVVIYFQCLIGQGVGRLPNMMAVRILFAGWILFSLVFSSVFQSNLTTALNFEIYEKQIASVQDMVDAKLTIGFFKNMEPLFANPDNKVDSYIYSHYVICDLGLSCMDRVAFKGDFATFKIERHLKFIISQYYLAKNGRSMVHVLNDRLFNILISYGFVKGFPMYNQVNNLLLQLKSTGFVQYYYRIVDDYVEKMEQEAKNVELVADDLELNELEGVFGLLIIGWMLAFVMFLMEHLVHLSLKKRRLPFLL